MLVSFAGNLAVAIGAGAAAVVVVALTALFVAMVVAEAVVLATPLVAVTFVAATFVAPSANPRFGVAKKTIKARAVEYKKRLCLPNLLRRKVGQDRFVRRFLKIRIILTPLSSSG